MRSANPQHRPAITRLRRAGHRLALVAIASLSACSPDTPTAPVPARQEPTATTYRVSPWTLVSGKGAAQPDLIATPGGRLLLTWVSTETGRRPALLFASHDGTRWLQASRTVAVGTALFANWADTPHLAATADGAYWVHWLQKSADLPYAYDVMLSRSRSNGRSWSPPIMVNDDGTTTEHGFVSLWPQAVDTLGVAWLDGRNTVAGAAAAKPGVAATPAPEAHAGHATGASADAGPMTLRAALFDGNLQRSQEHELDAMTCDCCQTDVAVTARGPLIVYRGRTPLEIRDILATRFDGGRWTAPQRVHADDWTMPACPVNGPAVAARGDAAFVAWFTAAGDVPTVKIARSDNAGDRFGTPVVVDRGAAVQGRVDLAYDGSQAWVLWLREDGTGQTLWLARYAADLTHELQRIEVARLQGRGRGTGFPKLALRAGVVHVVWTDVIDGAPQLRGARVATQAQSLPE